jgi:hypothetical protein
LDCSTAIAINCGDTKAGDTTTLPNTATNYICNRFVQDGGEQVFVFDVTRPTSWIATITSGNAFKIHLLLSCDVKTCILWDDYEIITPLLPPGKYYFVLDSAASDSGPYEIKFSCIIPTPPPIPVSSNMHFVFALLLLLSFIIIGNPVKKY